MSTGDGPFGPVVNGTQIVFFEYRPNKAAGYAFVALFALASLGHLICTFWHRAWFCIPFVLGGISETFGYYGRALASETPAKAGPFIMQNILILAGAPFLAATIYMSLGRVIIALEATRYSILNVRWMTKIYVLIDIACIFSQFIGAAIPASGHADAIRKGRVEMDTQVMSVYISYILMIVVIREVSQVGGDILLYSHWCGSSSSHLYIHIPATRYSNRAYNTYCWPRHSIGGLICLYSYQRSRPYSAEIRTPGVTFWKPFR
ncbi:hypothetical protein F4779DRAFT_411773 [Xylariaceae sp. FL0662B]|nr:hypothetical protein F4779DRAFT_411773 [Xylariaceae sp. FL0662B]